MVGIATSQIPNNKLLVANKKPTENASLFRKKAIVFLII
jgi:hypothetical protein